MMLEDFTSRICRDFSFWLSLALGDSQEEKSQWQVFKSDGNGFWYGGNKIDYKKLKPKTVYHFILWKEEFLVVKFGDDMAKIFCEEEQIRVEIYVKEEKIRAKNFRYETAYLHPQSKEKEAKFFTPLSEKVIQYLTECGMIEDLKAYKNRGISVAKNLGILEKKKFKNYEEFDNDKSRTENYTPPEYLVKPAEGDTGWAFMKAEFNKKKTRFKPRIDW